MENYGLLQDDKLIKIHSSVLNIRISFLRSHVAMIELEVSIKSFPGNAFMKIDVLLTNLSLTVAQT